MNVVLNFQENDGDTKSQSEQTSQSLGCNCSDIMSLTRMSCAEPSEIAECFLKDVDERLERR